MGGSYQKDKNIYALVNDWIHWQPGRVIRERERDVKRGYQGQKAGPGKSKSKVVQISDAKQCAG